MSNTFKDISDILFPEFIRAFLRCNLICYIFLLLKKTVFFSNFLARGGYCATHALAPPRTDELLARENLGSKERNNMCLCIIYKRRRPSPWLVYRLVDELTTTTLAPPAASTYRKRDAL
jgi:hypothetical protein